MKTIPLACILLFLAAAAAIAQSKLPAADAAPLVLEATITLPDVKGGFDLMAADTSGRRLFLAAEDNGSVEVLDIAAMRRIRSIGGMTEPKWIVYRAEQSRIFVSNGDGKVRAFDSRDFTPVRVFEFREKANNLRFDAATGELFVGIGATFGAIAVIDTKDTTSDKTALAPAREIPLAAYPKQFELDSDGNRIFVNVPAKNWVEVLDRAEGRSVATWRIRADAGEGNIPMGFDRAGHRLLVGMASGKLVVLDSRTGREIAVVEIAADADGVHYDAKRRLIYISCGAGFLDVVRQNDGDHYERIAHIPTAKGAATSLWVAELDRLYLAVPATDSRHAKLRAYKPATP